MNQKRQKFLLLFTAALLVISFGWLAWQATHLYLMRKGAQSNLHTTVLVEKMFQLLGGLDAEERESAVYLATKTNTDALAAKRKETNRLLRALHEGTQQSMDTGVREGILKQVEESLGSARSNVDTFSSTDGAVFYNDYHKNIAQALTHSMSENNAFFKQADRDGLLGHSLLIGDAYSAVVLEKNFLAYAVGSTGDTEQKRLGVWEQIIDETAQLDFSSINNVQVLQRLNGLIADPKIEKELSKVRLDCIKAMADADHTPDLKALTKAYGDKLSNLNKASQLLLARHRSDLLKRDRGLKEQMWTYGIGAILTLILLGVLGWVYRSIRQENLLLEETLKDIEFELDHEKKKELLQIIEQGDTHKTYAFFAETIKESNKIKDLFLANMSHEIRTPLNGIMGFTQLLKISTNNAEREEYVQVIEESSELLLSIVNDILDLSKIKADKIEVEEIPFDPLIKIESAVEALGAKSLLKEIEFGTYIDPALPASVLGDPTRLSQILVNLVGNAIKFTPPYGTISLSCERIADDGKSTTVRFSVKDTGIGISEEHQDKIFEAFSQADISTTRKFGGTGLGLSISNKLVSLMGGKLELDSVPSEGSIFYFTLTFKHAADVEEREVIRHEGVRVGLLLPARGIDRDVDKNLFSYLGYLGAETSVLYEDEIHDLDPGVLPDILFVDQRYIQRDGEADRILSLGTRIVLLSSGNLGKNLSILNDRFLSIIHKPINYTKITKILNIYAGQEGDEDPSISTQSRFDDLRVLVAEDNAINQKLIVSTLENFGIDVTMVVHGEEAVEMRQQNEYDLIFMDIQMPIMNGMEATENILRYERLNQLEHIPIIALTANALKGDREKYLAVGMDDYTPKPLKIDLIKEIIRRQCPGRERIVKQPAVAHVADVSAERMEELEHDKESKPNVLLFFANPLIQSIHEHMLKGIVECTFVKEESDLLSRLDTGEYAFLLLDSAFLPQDHCFFSDLLSEKQMDIYVFGENKRVECPALNVYETIRYVRDLLREKV